MGMIRYTIVLCAALALLGCSDSDSNDDVNTASIAIESLGLTAQGSGTVSTLPLDGSVEEVSLDWQVSASGPGNTYRVLVFAGTASDPFQTEIGRKGCSNSGSTELYGCNDKGEFSCTLSENQFSCELPGQVVDNTVSASVTRLTARACVFDGSLTEICDEQKFSAELEPVEVSDGDGSDGSGSDDDASGDEAGDGSGTDGNGDGDNGSDSGSPGDGSGSDDSGSDDSSSGSDGTGASGTYPDLSDATDLMPPSPPDLGL